MAAGSHIDLFWIMLDHPQRANVGLSLVLKFVLDRICIPRYCDCFYFGVLAGNCYFTPILGAGVRAYFCQMTSPIELNPNKPVFTALHGMQRGLNDEISVRLSVRLSVCLSVCQTRAL